MLYIENSPGSFAPWAGEAIFGVRHPLNIEQLWPAAQLAEVKLFAPAAADAVPDDKVSIGQTVQRVGGVVKYAHILANKPQPTLAQRRDIALPRLSQKRWEVETGGIVAMGVSVRTDEIGQSKLTGALALFDNDPTLTSVDWEAQPGVWVTLDGPTVAGLGVLVGRHVQACFSRARVVGEAILAATTHDAMDAAIAEIETGWPE